MYYKYIKDSHKHSVSQLKFNTVLDAIASPIVYFLFMLIMILNYKAYKVYVKSNTKID